MALREKAVAGVFWGAVERFGQTGCAFLVQLVLARLLLPEQFGLIAMVAVFVALANAVVDSGFANAIVQKSDLSEADRTTALVFNIIMGVVMGGVLWLSAPRIAGFYDNSELIPVVRWLSLSLVLGSFGGVHAALLTREMAFRKTALASVPATLLSGVVGITMALSGMGVWSLVGQTLTQQAARSLLLWWASRWRPQQGFSADSFRSMFPYGSRLALSSMLDQGFQNAYVLVIGKLFTPADVGFYQRAKSLQQLPVANIYSILGRVLFSLFSELQSEPERLRRVMRRALQLGSLAIFIPMAALAALAEPLVVFLIGEKWLPTVPMLRPLCVLGALYPLHAINLNLLKALGYSDKFLRLEIIKKALVVVNIALTYRMGVQPMIYGMIVASFLGLGINTYYARHYVGYGLYLQIRDVARIMALSVTVFLGMWGMTKLVSLPAGTMLLIGGATGLLIILCGLRLMRREVREEISYGLTRALPARLVGLLC